MPGEIKILSAGAVAPGLVKAAEAFRDETGHAVNISFATAPTILRRIGGGESFDIVIAPASVLDELANTRQIVAATRIAVGRIGVGVMVRDGSARPKIATVEEFTQSLRSAESLIYNQASTGIYLEQLFERLGIGPELQAKTTRYPDFAAVRDHVAKGKGREIGLGATTVIAENSGKGVQFAGPLPAEIQNYTAYAAVSLSASTTEVARQFLRYLSSPEGKSLLAAAGIE
ncbi:MAG TPA: substrate-binding domain-containing protein [Candidatus Binatia bacterium]